MTHALLLSVALLSAAPPANELLRELRYRAIGPFRGGRTKAASGVPQRPGVFYVGAVNGGVFRTDDYGRTWMPLFDDQPTASIGALAVAPSNPDVIYVGSGEGLHRPDLSTGDGIYKSTDGGKTFRHLGLRDAQQIPQIAIDPRNPDRLFVAALGHPYGPNEERGIFRSTDGGETFEKVLYRDPDSGGADVVLDPSNPDIVYASLWEAREAPWENGEFSGPGSGLYKSVDGGTHWRKLTKGLPTYEADELGRIGIGIAPSRPSRLFATVAAKKNGGLYRSDDAGESWTRITADQRVAERADDFAEVKVHPRDPDIVFTGSVVVWKSTDGGKTWNALRGAPGGDDYHRIWIDPERPDTMLIACDQGAIVTVNGGRTFSSWYNQSTAQMFHVNADNDFPYRLCGGQQESGSACVRSRGQDGAITFREWHPVAAEEYGYAVPDPRNPDIIYGGKITRYDRRTTQARQIAPVMKEGASYRVIRTQPVVFSPFDPRTLFFASNTLWKTSDEGETWSQSSPDLARATWTLPANVGKYAKSKEAAPARRGVVYALAPSPVDRETIWAGTDDGLLQLTRDGGKSWNDVTPPALKAWAKVSILEASHTAVSTAYAAINTLRLDDLNPHILRTRDFGKSWTEIVRGIPGGETVNVVREDPARKGLLFAGTERSVYVSFDDGDDWQLLRLNLPATSVRDLVVKDDDLAIATHGRGFFILDDLAPLREMDDRVVSAEVHLFRPQRALRVRWNTNTDTPLPPDEPMGENPPDGVPIDYLLRTPLAKVALEVIDGAGKVVRRFTSDAPRPPPGDEGNVPRYWIRPPAIPSAQAGFHRFVWDLHGEPPDVLEPAYTIAAIPGNTPREPRGPWALPGRYTVRLIAGPSSITQPLQIEMDPRLHVPIEDLRKQHDLALRLADLLGRTTRAVTEIRQARAGAGRTNPTLDTKLAALETKGRRSGRGADQEPRSLTSLNTELSELLVHVEEVDAAPTPALVKAAQAASTDAEALLSEWTKLLAETRPR
ncbi:MAG: WD40/YVTN/BNR-like repeat-containing protein [Myxococcales bacterium]